MVGSGSDRVTRRGLDCIERVGDSPTLVDDILGGGGGLGLLPNGPDEGNLDGEGGPGLAESVV